MTPPKTQTFDLNASLTRTGITLHALASYTGISRTRLRTLTRTPGLTTIDEAYLLVRELGPDLLLEATA